MTFPRSTERGPIEAWWAVACRGSRNCFPRSTERGPIEAGERLFQRSRDARFPRSTERGPIEAVSGCMWSGFTQPFRVQQNAAPLKPDYALVLHGDKPLSAFNRTRPH